MKNFCLSLLVGMGALLLSFTPVQALYQTSSEILEIGEDEVIDDDVFLSSKTIYIRGTINGDVYVLGGEVEINGTINGDVTVIGGNINLSGMVSEDVRLIGGDITVNDAEIGDDLNLIGGSLTVDNSSTVGGSLVSIGGSLTNRADVGNHFVAVGGSISLNNHVGGDVEIGSPALIIGPEASISGSLKYPEEADSQIAESASVSGEVVRFPATAKSRELTRVKESAPEAGAALWSLNLTFKTWSYFAALLVGLLLLYFFPQAGLEIAENLRTKALPSLLVGFLVFVLVGPVFLMLLLTVIGIPLALLLLAKFLILLYLTKLVVGMAIGITLKEQFNWDKLGNTLTLITGLAVYYLITLIPVVSFFISMLAIFAGLGAIYIWGWRHFRSTTA